MSIWIPAVLLILPGTALVLRSPTIITKIGPNPFTGIRTEETLDNNATWALAHRKAWPYVRTACLICIAVLLAVIGIALFVHGPAQSHIIGWGTAAGLICWIGINLLGTRAGLRAALAAHHE